MDAVDRRKWILMVLLLGALYFIIGVVFATLAGGSASNAARVSWNRLGFLISAIALTLHIAYEHFRLRSSARTVAWHVSLAVALGAFALAAKANVHGYRTGLGNTRLLAFALLAWPLITGVPAFAVALVTAAVLGLRRRK